ncbi:uncharacterized protein [Oscarella lobularis]|uniref:uncharacterized protein n=1 Tax=Oscarella lobularis TaxID=121494 RepID=UPI00331389BB
MDSWLETKRPPLKVVIHQSELGVIRSCVLDYPDCETGGDLFGLWSKDNTVNVLFVLGPGKNSRRTTTSFFQNSSYLKRAGECLVHKLGLCHIGEWHSHHTLDLAYPSSGDQRTVERNMPTYGWKRFLVFIANIDRGRGYSDYSFRQTPQRETGLGCFLFESGGKSSMLPMMTGSFKPIPGQSPYRKMVNGVHKLGNIVYDMTERDHWSDCSLADAQTKKESSYYETDGGSYRLVPVFKDSSSSSVASSGSYSYSGSSRSKPKPMKALPTAHSSVPVYNSTRYIPTAEVSNYKGTSSSISLRRSNSYGSLESLPRSDETKFTNAQPSRRYGTPQTQRKRPASNSKKSFWDQLDRTQRETLEFIQKQITDSQLVKERDLVCIPFACRVPGETGVFVHCRVVCKDKDKFGRKSSLLLFIGAAAKDPVEIDFTKDCKKKIVEEIKKTSVKPF